MESDAKEQMRKLMAKYINVVDRYHRSLQLLEMEQKNTQKFIDLLEEEKKRKCELERQLELFRDYNKNN